MRTWPRRKLTQTDGEYILWHVKDALMADPDFWHETYSIGVERALDTVRRILADMTKLPGGVIVKPKHEVLATSEGYLVMANTRDNKFWVPVSKVLPTRERAQNLADLLNAKTAEVTL